MRVRDYLPSHYSNVAKTLVVTNIIMYYVGYQGSFYLIFFYTLTATRSTLVDFILNYVDPGTNVRAGVGVEF